ncbi:tyrosine-type recombinase/integrase [Ilyobacter polytropus]|uniref:Integrase family protein n=1 Tax=Ilyobacter polytropus (strain ATCC 51220 / DSM 2926 / LMG 16218 / CuHBu1) TaxID=572544 RepID=E3H625_ILYPC|nr:tyrosine-type recombinase/integrase [Ilyobacter polytropus]ADO82315.1 integrase family protein [Ilyobacter polytropus DSM 2926]
MEPFLLEKLIKDFIYFEEFGDGKSLNTIKSFKKDLGQLRDYLSKKENINNPKDIKEMALRGFLVELQKENIGKRSLNRKISSLRTFFKYLKNQGYIEKNPTILLTGPAFKADLPEILTKEEIDRIREVIDIEKTNGIRDRLIVELLYSSGIRTSELLSLGESLFDLEKRQLRVTGGKQPRIVFFSERTREYFKRYVESKKKKYRAKYTADILFVNGSGTRLSDRSLRRIIERYAKKAEIQKEISPHTFRHTFGVYMLTHGMGLMHLQELMGHVSVESTKIYEEFVNKPKILKGYNNY